MSNEFVQTITERYIELYEKISGKPFVKSDLSNLTQRIEQNVLRFLKDQGI